MTTATQRHNGRAKRHNGVNGVQGRMKSLRGDIGALQRDVQGLASDVGDAAESQFDNAVNSTMRTAREAVDRVENWGAQNVKTASRVVKRKVNQNMKSARATVKKQPFLACSLAAGAGMLFGLYLSMGRGTSDE